MRAAPEAEADDMRAAAAVLPLTPRQRAEAAAVRAPVVPALTSEALLGYDLRRELAKIAFAKPGDEAKQSRAASGMDDETARVLLGARARARHREGFRAGSS